MPGGRACPCWGGSALSRRLHAAALQPKPCCGAQGPLEVLPGRLPGLSLQGGGEDELPATSGFTAALRRAWRGPQTGPSLHLTASPAARPPRSWPSHPGASRELAGSHALPRFVSFGSVGGACPPLRLLLGRGRGDPAAPRTPPASPRALLTEAYLPSVLEKVPAGNLGLPGKPKPGFPGRLGSVTKLSSVSAPRPAGMWTPVLCVRWKRPKACVRKGAARLGQAISSRLPGGLGKAGPSPGSPSTFCAW